MCVRSSMGNEIVEPIVLSCSAKRTQSDRLTRVKEKYIRLHDEMLDREKQERQQQQQQSMFHVSDLVDHLFATSTIQYSLLLQKLAEYYEIIRHTKAFK